MVLYVTDPPRAKFSAPLAATVMPKMMLESLALRLTFAAGCWAVPTMDPSTEAPAVSVMELEEKAAPMPILPPYDRAPATLKMPALLADDSATLAAVML